MINCDMRYYDFYTIGDNNDYGQSVVADDVKGSVKLAIYNTSQQIQDNILYKNASYLGLTADAAINDRYVIQYGNEKLKVLYVQPKGKLRQVYFKNYD